VTGFTIEDARQVQRDLELGDVHVAYVDPDEGFVLAHTNLGRSLIAQGYDLEWCEIHHWLAREPTMLGYIEVWGGCFPRPGWYKISGLHKAEGLAL
jgi:hypothetical protein